MNKYPENDYRSYLEHHGILGMKWGVTNGPPYPLGIGDHNASERKAGWMDSLKDENRVASTFKANKMLKEAGLRYASSDGKYNYYSYDDNSGNDRYRVFLSHNRGKDSYKDLNQKIQNAKDASKYYVKVQKNINKHCKKVLEDTYGKDNLYLIVEDGAFESNLSGVQNMIVIEPNVLSIWAEYSRTSDPNDTRCVDFYDIKYDLKKHKALSRGESVIE